MDSLKFQTTTANGTQFLRNSRSGAAPVVPAKKPSIVMVGMHLTRTRGGITTVTDTILRSEFSDYHDVNYIPSQAEDLRKPGKLMLAVKAFFRFCLAMLKRPSLAYIHIGSNASLYRESLFVYAAKLFRVPVLIHFHAGDIDEYLPYQPAIGKTFIRGALSAGDRVIAVSERSAAQLREIDPRLSIAVIPNAIDLSAFRPGEVKAKSSSPIRLLFVGAFDKLKGERDLLSALSQLKDLDEELRVDLLGYGGHDLRNFCTELGITSMIDHIGPVAMSDRIHFYERADIFVLPTYAEGMPMSVIEAMAAGLAVVTTDVGGIPEIVTDGEDGFLIQPGDVDALAERIRLLVSDTDLRQRIGRQARTSARQKFDLSRYVERVREVTVEAMNQMPTDLKLVVKRSVKSVSAVAFRSRNRSSSVRIFAYHRVVADIQKAERDSYHGLVVSSETFRRHCELFKEAFQIVPLDKILDVNDASRPVAALTFDDGYADFYEEAFPILRSLGLPATVFVPTECMESNELLDHDRLYWLLKLADEQRIDVVPALQAAGVDDSVITGFRGARTYTHFTERLVYLPIALRRRVLEHLENAIPTIEPYPRESRLLNWDQIRDMSEAGVDFGAHTANHVVLTREQPGDIQLEIAKSKMDLETNIGRIVTTFAYPNGEYTPAIRNVVQQTGFTCAVTTRRHVNYSDTDPFALGRFSLCEESTRGIMGRYSPSVAAWRLGVR